jgi:hypothetical protein
MGDSSAEMRAIMMLMFPCPPVPVVASRVTSDWDYAQMSSHDSLAFCVDVMGRRLNWADNEARKRTQMRLTDEFLAWVKAWAWQMDPEKKPTTVSDDDYHTVCEFNHAYMSSYFPQKKNMDIRFNPIDEADARMLSRMREWLAAREVVQEKNENAQARDHAWKDARRLLADCLLIVNEYSEGERERHSGGGVGESSVIVSGGTDDSTVLVI